MRRRAMRASAAIPPTTPPTIAPVFELFEGEGLADVTGMEVVTDTSVVTMVVDPREFVELVVRVNNCGGN
jgi:hypothetical protein